MGLNWRYNYAHNRTLTAFATGYERRYILITDVTQPEVAAAHKKLNGRLSGIPF